MEELEMSLDEIEEELVNYREHIDLLANESPNLLKIEMMKEIAIFFHEENVIRRETNLKKSGNTEAIEIEF